MEEILKYISLIALCGTAISFFIGLLKWLDQRNSEQEQKQHEAFHKMVCIASGVDVTGRKIKMVQQIAAVYQLQVYKRYSFAAIPVLKLMQFEFDQQKDDRINFMNEAINNTIEVLLINKGNLKLGKRRIRSRG